MADLVDNILAKHSCGAETEAREAAGPFNSVAERHRQALIAKLEEAKAAIEILISLTTDHGDAEEAFAAQARALGAKLNEAGDDASRFHFALECRGVC